MDYCHYWDKTIQERYKEFVIHLDQISSQEEVEIWREILNYSPQLSHVLSRIYNEDVVDSNVDDRPRRLGAQIWKKINGNRDMQELFMNQMKELADTNGYCPQGRTNRFIQVLFAALS